MRDIAQWLQAEGDEILYDVDAEDALMPTVPRESAPPAPSLPIFDLRTQPEIFEHDRNKPQILDAPDYVTNVHIAVGYASRCWHEDGSFDTEQALRLANELCAYIRLLKDGALAC